MSKMRRGARYLLGVPGMEIQFVEQYPPGSISVYVDSDWAGCKISRKSTSGGVKHCIKTWATTQKTRATSSAEAEFYGIVEGASRGLGLKSLAADLGSPVEIVIYSDVSAGRSFGLQKRIGQGSSYRDEILMGSGQDLIKDGRLKLAKVKGKENPADIGTKHLSLADTQMQLSGIGTKMISRKVALKIGQPTQGLE